LTASGCLAAGSESDDELMHRFAVCASDESSNRNPLVGFRRVLRRFICRRSFVGLRGPSCCAIFAGWFEEICDRRRCPPPHR
jgi:hypothetical protein